MRRGNPLGKVVLGLVVLTVFGILFASALRDVASEPYTVSAGDLRQWTVALHQRSGPDGPLIVLRPPTALPMGLFDQVFQRTMESFTTPVEPGIPLVLQREFVSSLAGAVTPEELVGLARGAGLENASLRPHCMAVHRTSGGREQRQFFVLFELPQLAQFRASVASVVQARGGTGVPFDPEAVSAALLVATSDARLLWQVPRRAGLEGECEAPVTSG